MTIENHYGKFVYSEVPTTGVYNSNQIAWGFMYMEDEICLQCEDWIKSHGDTDGYDPDNCTDCFDLGSYCLDWIECQDHHDKLLGDWILDTKTGLYEPDKNGEFSAIENGSLYTIQVIWSKYLTNGALCSPCYPGQVDIGSQGDFLAYALPDYLLYSND